ncbi:TlpA family protein disulfide reductase [Alteromonas flava]|uniref:TlpA family protein disulfide reductase n=1 Tax=Alteromonas flava TaxID=2048003 RepID=UPI000C2922F5|nr:TlpA disulfide reductase family protein [Alteromonas flava]
MQKWLFAVVAGCALAAGIVLYQSQQYDFQTLQGDSYQWQQLEGDWVVVNYFAEWCAPCLKEVPELNAFGQWAEEQSNVHLFAISYDALSREKLSDIATQYRMTFDLLVPELTRHVPVKKPQYLPATFIIKPDGSITPPLLGEQTNQSIQAALVQLQEAF